MGIFRKFTRNLTNAGKPRKRKSKSDKIFDKPKRKRRRKGRTRKKSGW